MGQSGDRSNVTRGGRGSGPRRRGAPSNRGGPRSGGGRPPLSADRLDRDLDAYMLRDKSTGAKILDADLDSYMMGAPPKQ